MKRWSSLQVRSESNSSLSFCSVLIRFRTPSFISGANTGIGKETTKDLYKRGAKVVMLCRSEERANTAIKWISDNTLGDGKGALIFEQCDLSSMESVRKCAGRSGGRCRGRRFWLQRRGRFRLRYSCFGPAW